MSTSTVADTSRSTWVVSATELLEAAVVGHHALDGETEVAGLLVEAALDAGKVAARLIDDGTGDRGWRRPPAP